MRKDKIILAGRQYGKTQAKELVKIILNKYPLDHSLQGEDFDMLCDLIEYHPEAADKIGCGIQAIEIVREEQYGGRRFEIVRTDGSRQDFSYIKCLEKTNLHFKDVMKAFRYEILHQVREYKHEAYVGRKYVRCAITNLNVRQQDCHVDHMPPLTFDTLVFNFLKEKSMTISDVLVKDTEFVSCLELADLFLAIEWKEYHCRNARLRITLDHANLGQMKTKVDWNRLDSLQDGLQGR